MSETLNELRENLKDGGKWLGTGRGYLQVSVGYLPCWDSNELVTISIWCFHVFISKVMSEAVKEHRSYILNSLELKGLWHCFIESGLLYKIICVSKDIQNMYNITITCKSFTPIAIEAAAFAIYEIDERRIDG